MDINQVNAGDTLKHNRSGKLYLVTSITEPDSAEVAAQKQATIDATGSGMHPCTVRVVHLVQLKDGRKYGRALGFVARTAGNYSPA